MSFRWIENHIHGSESDQCVYDTSKEPVSENQRYHVEIKQSHQSSIESSDDEKYPCNLPDVWWISEFFHNDGIWKI